MPIRLAWLVEHHDTSTQLVKTHQLIAHPRTQEIEMHDLKARKLFLKKTRNTQLEPLRLTLGQTITLYARQLKIVAYADQLTASFFSPKSAATLAIVTDMRLLGHAFDAVAKVGLDISEMKLVTLAAAEAAAIFSDPSLAAAASAGPPILCAELRGEGAVDSWAGAVSQQQGIYGSASPEAAVVESAALLWRPAACLPPEGSSLLLVRPHAVADRKLGGIVHRLHEGGFAIAGAAMLQLSRQNALEFFEVYRGVVPEYLGWVEEVSCGKCVVLQCVYRDDPASSVEALRMLCGAHDPAVAASVEPDSIRALFGESRVKNAVHCSDLTEDGPSEVHYFFP